MFKYIVKRILLAILILLGVSMIIYSLVKLMPVNFIEDKYRAQLLDGTIKQEEVDRMLELYGLKDNSFGGIVKGYFMWIGNVLRGDLGHSFKSERRYRLHEQRACHDRHGAAYVLLRRYLYTAFLRSARLGSRKRAAKHAAFYGERLYAVYG